MVRRILLFAALALMPAWASAQPEPGVWPAYDAKFHVEVIKVSGKEMTDVVWLHLHEGEADALSFTVKLFMSNPSIFYCQNAGLPAPPCTGYDIPFGDTGDGARAPHTPAGLEVRYFIRGIAVTDWLAAPYRATINISDPVFDSQILNGIHDINIDVRGTGVTRSDFTTFPAFVHVHRNGNATAATVPVIARDSQYDRAGSWAGPGADYVNVNNRNFVARPLVGSVTPWTTAPHLTQELYFEQMAPHSNLFLPHQMWWQEPASTPDANLKFARGIPPKFYGEDDRILYSNTGSGAGDYADGGYAGHRTFPYKDGGRTVAWTSPYTTGQVDSTGGLAFVEMGGPLRYMKPDGEVITVVGWRVDPAKDPVWMLKPLATIRQNMEFRGTFTSGQYADPNEYGFHTPVDVAIDPLDENVWYVVGFHDHVVWKVVIADRVTWAATVSVFAGSTSHAFGYVNATGTAARFKGPHSIVFDPVCDCMYVADQDNDAIRKVTRAGVVTTVFGTQPGAPTMASRLQAAGAIQCSNEQMYDTQLHCFDKTSNQSFSIVSVTEAQAAAGTRPDIYVPYVVRVDSFGNLIVFDSGFGVIRRIKMSGETKVLATPGVQFTPNNRGWMWLDVDRWGNSGPINGIYYAVTVGGDIATEDKHILYGPHYNEVLVWVDAEGVDEHWLTGHDMEIHPHGWGIRAGTDAPHYPWMVAVDPRGALFISGIGEHGITRMRMKRKTDPYPSVTAYPAQYNIYHDGHMLWWKYQTVFATPSPNTAGIPGRNMKFGWEGHNYLGFADMWDPALRNASDAALVAAFEIPSVFTSNATMLAKMLSYLRMNAGPLPAYQSGTGTLNFHLKADATEVSGVTNGSVVTPTVNASQQTGTVVKVGTGAITFTPVYDGNGAAFTPGGQQQSNTAFYKFTGTNLGNIFSQDSGAITFYLKPAYTHKERVDLGNNNRDVFQVWDHNGIERFRFSTSIQLGNRLKFIFVVPGLVSDVGIQEGQEDIQFPKDLATHFRLTWTGTECKVYIDDVLHITVPYTKATPTWGANAIFTFGANAQFNGGYFGSNDAIDDFRVYGPSGAGPSPPADPSGRTSRRSLRIKIGGDE